VKINERALDGAIIIGRKFIFACSSGPVNLLVITAEQQSRSFRTIIPAVCTLHCTVPQIGYTSRVTRKRDEYNTCIYGTWN